MQADSKTANFANFANFFLSATVPFVSRALDARQSSWTTEFRMRRLSPLLVLAGANVGENINARAEWVRRRTVASIALFASDARPTACKIQLIALTFHHSAIVTELLQTLNVGHKSAFDAHGVVCLCLCDMSHGHTASKSWGQMSLK